MLDELLDESREIQPGDPPAEWATTYYQYDSNLNVTQVTHPEGNLEALTYDPRNLLESHTRGADTPDASTAHYTYNGDREQISITDGRGSLWSTEYDGFGRVAKTPDPEGNASLMTYDNAHNVTEQKGQNAEEAVLAHRLIQYDGLNRPTSQTMKHSFQGTDLTDVLESATYDAASNLKTVTNPRSYSKTRGYDAVERLGGGRCRYQGPL